MGLAPSVHIDLPELPDLTGVLGAAARLMNTVSDELPRAVDALAVLANAKHKEVNGE